MRMVRGINMRIGFTGHRDRITKFKDLGVIARRYPGAVWVHGGADGFDAQVDAYARENNIPVEIIRPDYERFRGNEKAAPLVSNQKIVDSVDLLIACYDGRLTGGTFYTVCYATRRGVPIVTVSVQMPLRVRS
jgi:hypothetical protein